MLIVILSWHYTHNFIFTRNSDAVENTISLDDDLRPLEYRCYGTRYTNNVRPTVRLADGIRINYREPTINAIILRTAAA